MNILVLSDTHGDLSRATEMYERLTAGIIIDCIIHCGDYGADAEKLAVKLHQDVYYVRGNCDGARRREFRTLDTPAGKILLTHGHTENVNYGTDRLVRLAESQGCKAACYGHTHIPEVTRSPEGMLVVNPGSLTKPLDGTQGSCALIVATEKNLTASLIYY